MAQSDRNHPSKTRLKSAQRLYFFASGRDQKICHHSVNFKATEKNQLLAEFALNLLLFKTGF